MLGLDPRLLRFLVAVHGAFLLKVVLIFFGYRFGKYLDLHFGTHPWVMIGGIAFGAGLGLFWVVYTIRRYAPK